MCGRSVTCVAGCLSGGGSVTAPPLVSVACPATDPASRAAAAMTMPPSAPVSVGVGVGVCVCVCVGVFVCMCVCSPG